MTKQATCLQVSVGLLLIVLHYADVHHSLARAESTHAHYVISGGAIVQPLTTTAGNPERGEQIVLDRERGDCVVCHVLPLPNRQFHGTVGPPLDGVGDRYPVGVLRLRLVDSKAITPQSIMPAYHKVSGLVEVPTRLHGKPILTAQEVEDVVAYLATLKSAPLESGQPDVPTSSPTEVSTSQSAPEQIPYSVENRRSGYTYLSVDNQQLQNDDFANPGMLWVERGRELWKTPDGDLQKSCTTCHAEAGPSMRGVRLRFPRFDQRQKKLINLEQQINRCRQEHMHASPYAYESEPLLALTTLIAFQSRGLPLTIHIDDSTRPFFEAGRAFFTQRRGQLDLACAHCHDQYAGRRLRGDIISQGQVNGFPIYRQLWQTLGSAHRMFAWCNTAIRAEALLLGSDEYVNLELYMAWRARGLPVESPAIRR